MCQSITEYMTLHKSLPVAVVAAAADPPAGSVARRKTSKALKGGHTCFKCGVERTTQWRTMQEGGEARYVCNKCGLRNDRDRPRQLDR